MSAKSHDSLGRVRRRSQGGAGPKHLPSKDAVKTGAFNGRPPEGLGVSGTLWWRWAVVQLEAMGIADNADREHLRLCAETYQEYRDAKTFVRKHGAHIIDSKGLVSRNPAQVTAEKARLALRSFYSDLCLTPSARAKFGTPEKEDDPMGDLMRQSQRN